MATSPTLSVWTSRYANEALAQAHEVGYVLARITRGNARFFKLPHINLAQLAPTKYEFDLPGTAEGNAEFDRSFTARLDRIGPDRVLALLADAQGDAPGVILLCFEDVRTGELCHRTVIADWLAARAAVRVQELPDPSTPTTRNQKPSGDVQRPLW
jgi:hypothetical protein